MAVFYFAYGSNMHPVRLSERVNSASFVDVARLADHRLVFHKRGQDGSGKCDIVGAAGEEVWGVVYSLDDHDGLRLDAIEGEGYGRVDLRLVTRSGGGRLDAFAYRAKPSAIVADARPFDWYLELVRRGASHHGLPAPYQAALASIAVVPDPDVSRRQKYRQWLEQG